MFWECPVVISLWTHVNLVLSSLLRIDWSVNPSLCLLNDDSGLCISSMQKRMLFAGFTAAKKTIIQNWFTPHMCRKTYWICSLLQIVTCECTTARAGGARPSTIDAWQCFLFDIRDYIKEWLLCFYCPSLSPSLLTGLWDVEYVSVVLLYFGCGVVLCVKKKKNVDKKKKKLIKVKNKNIYIYIYITALESLFLRGPHTSIEAALVLNQWIRAWTTADACHWLTLGITSVSPSRNFWRFRDATTDSELRVRGHYTEFCETRGVFQKARLTYLQLNPELWVD